MKTNHSRNPKLATAFTLIEMLVVIAIIAILAAMIFPASAVIKNKMTITKAKAELKAVVLAIDSYKIKKGYYPPDHALAVGVDPIVNSLYFELSGVTNIPAGFQTFDGAAMITVTSADVSKDLKNANILITVLPQEKEKSALDFAKRMRGDMRTDIKKRLPIKTIPFVEIEIDEGEKNRQRIESVLLQDRLSKPNKIEEDYLSGGTA